MGHLDKVAPAVQKFVDEVKAMGGSKKKIDTQAEYDKLQEYLTGNASNMNKSETEFINGFMIEYTSAQEAKKAAEEAENVTEATRDFAKAKAKLMGNKKHIDTEAEARELLRYLDSEDLKPADKEYIQKVIIDSGYGDLLNDRVGALEDKAKANEAKDAEQDQAIADLKTQNDKQDELINDLVKKHESGEDVHKELYNLVKTGQIKDQNLQKAIEECKQKNGEQDWELFRQRCVDWFQNTRMNRIESGS